MTIGGYLNTVDWVGDGDDADFFRSIERVFDLTLRRELPWTTFGEVADHVVKHVDRRGAGKGCATQMAFYRLRKALALRRTTTPTESLAPILASGLKARFADLAADTNLEMPRLDLGLLGWASLTAFATAMITVFALGFSAEGNLAGFGLGALGFLFWQFDQRRLPKHIVTMGDLARAVGDENRGRLAR
jgi:hypothetical protein